MHMTAPDGRHAPILVTVDVVVLTVRNIGPHTDPMRSGGPELKLCAALLLRRVDPFRGRWALPSDFVTRDPQGRQESLDEAALRTLAGALGASVPRERIYLDQLRAYGDPVRDPRGAIAVAYVAVVPPAVVAAGERLRQSRSEPAVPPTARGPAAAVSAVQWRPVYETLTGNDAFAFDHAQMLADGLDRVRELINRTALATAFLDEAFTVPQLRRVYETVWGMERDTLDAGNFRALVSRMPDVFEELDDAAGPPDGDPAPWDVRAADAAVLYKRSLRHPERLDAYGYDVNASPGRPPSRYFRRGRRVLERGFTAPLDRLVKTRR